MAPTGTPYQQGNPVTVVEPFFGDDGSTLVDPDGVTVNVRQPDNTLVSFEYGVDAELTKLEDGVYQLAFGVPSQVYEYHGEFVGILGSSVNWTLPFDFYVIPSSVFPPAEPVGPKMPPCQAWISGDDIAGCSGASDLDQQGRDSIAVIASMLMFELTARRFYGICGPVTVRPCQSGCGQSWGFPSYGGWMWNFWSGDWGRGWFWGNQDGPRQCGCGYSSVVELAGGAAVTQITEVKIGGVVLPTTFDDGAPTYRLDQWRYLTRLSDPANPSFPLHWPYCQRLDLEDDQPGTFSVSYLYGVAPPPLCIEAAKQIACQLILAQSGQACSIPAKVSRIVRQGATLDMITPLASALRSGSTGLFSVDAAIAAYNPAGLKRPPAVFSPDTNFPVRVGAE